MKFKLVEDWITEDKDAFVTKDEYEVRAFISRCKHATRLIYDRNNEWYIGGDAYYYNHDKLVTLATDFEYYSDENDIDYISLDGDGERIFIIKSNPDSEEDLYRHSDGYEYRFTYESGVSVFTDDDWYWEEATPLANILGKLKEKVHIAVPSISTICEYIEAKGTELKVAPLDDMNAEIDYKGNKYIIDVSSSPVIWIKGEDYTKRYWNDDYNVLAFDIIAVITTPVNENWNCPRGAAGPIGLPYGYRDNHIFGDGVRKLEDVVRHEIFDLGNTDIPETLLQNWDLSDEQKNVLETLIQEVEDEADCDIYYYMEEVPKIIRSKYPNAEYCLWLCLSPEDVRNSYLNGEDGDIEKYMIECPEPISDLGKDGLLFVYSKDPEEFKLEEHCNE